MTHPGLGPVKVLAFTLTLGPAERFQLGKQIATTWERFPTSIPAEGASSGSDTSANKQSVSARVASGGGRNCGPKVLGVSEDES